MNNLPPSFSPQLIGRTEKTLNAILDRQLAGAVTEPQWVTLVLIAAGRRSADRGQLTAQVAHALRVNQKTAATHIGQLARKGLVQIAPGPGAGVALTEAGQHLLGCVRKQVGEITQRLWGDLPVADLQVAGRVLSTVLERAAAELETGS